MKRMAILGMLCVSAFVFASGAQAGKVELSTYYPAPNGEYSELQATQTLKVPVKTTAGGVKDGEIWVDPCYKFPAKTWDGNACA